MKRYESQILEEDASIKLDKRSHKQFMTAQKDLKITVRKQLQVLYRDNSVN